MIKYIMQFFLCIGLCFLRLIGEIEYQSNIIEFTQSEVFIPHNLGDIKLHKDAHGFYIVKEGKIHNIAWCFCDQLLQNMSDEELLIFLGRSNFVVIMFTPDEYFQFKQNNFIEIKADEIASRIISKKNNGYIKVNQMDNGTYTLRAQLRLLGGGGEKTVKELASSTATGVTVIAGSELGIAATVGATSAIISAVTPTVVPIVSGTVITAGAQVTSVGGALIATYPAVGVTCAKVIGGAMASVVSGPALAIVGGSTLLYAIYKVLQYNTRPTEDPIIPSQNPPDSSDGINNWQQSYVRKYPKLLTPEEIDAEFKACKYECFFY